MNSFNKLDVVVIGAGQAGLAAGYFLARSGLRFEIVDGASRIGDSWRNRWDSLRLFTPAKLDGLPGMPFPAAPNTFPTKDDLADYLEAYARRFQLPVRLSTRVQKVTKTDGGYLVRTSKGVILADHVVIAMAPYQTPYIPSFGRELDPGVVQLHSSDYRRPGQVPDGPVLVVGAGNSGAEIALELTRAGHDVVLAGRATGHVPYAIDGFAARLFLHWLILRIVFHHLLKVSTPMGRRARDRGHGKGVPLIRTKPKDLVRAGIRRTNRVIAVESGRPLIEDGERLEVKSVVWATGFRSGFEWLDRPVFDALGAPIHQAGVVNEESGLYFVGLHFLYAMSSAMLHGVGRDAERIVGVIRARSAESSKRVAV